tara:strand:+ start:390 stop:557 length:168 start_codon:yes stop_codon:yes gene_type:complete
MKAVPITQRCKSPMKLDEATLKAAEAGNSTFSSSAAGQVAKAGKKLGESFAKSEE